MSWDQRARRARRVLWRFPHSLHDRIRLLLAVAVAAYLLVQAPLAVLQPGASNLTWIVALLLVVMALSSWAGYRLGWRPATADALEAIIVGGALWLWPDLAGLDFVVFLAAVNAALYRRGLGLAGVWALFAAALVLGQSASDARPVDMLIGPFQVAVAVTVPGLLSDIARRADAALRQERLMADAGRRLTGAGTPAEVADVLADVGIHLCRAADLHGARVTVTLGDRHRQVVAAARGPGAASVGATFSADTLAGSSAAAPVGDALNRRGGEAVPLASAVVGELRAALGAPPMPTGSGLLLPLAVPGRVHGVLAVSGPVDLERHHVAAALRSLAAEGALSLDSLALRDDLRRREHHLATLFAHSHDVVTVLDGGLTARSHSPAIAALGWRPDQLAALPLDELVHPEDRPAVTRALDDLRERPGATAAFEWRARCADGTWRQVESLATNLLGDPDVGGILLTSRDITERKALEEQLAHQATHDPLTGLANRFLFSDRLEHALAQVGRSDAHVGLCFIDLDDFKAVNDAHGHGAGDRVLVAVAGRLGEAVRAGDTVARLGGDEFAVILEHVPSEADAVDAAERLLQAVRQPLVVDGQRVDVGASVGVAVARPGWTADDLLRAADGAMYDVKSTGPGRRPAIARSDVLPGGRAAMAARLRRALERGRSTPTASAACSSPTSHK